MSGSVYHHGNPDAPGLTHSEWRHGPLPQAKKDDLMTDEQAERMIAALERIAAANEALLAGQSASEEQEPPAPNDAG